MGLGRGTCALLVVVASAGCSSSQSGGNAGATGDVGPADSVPWPSGVERFAYVKAGALYTVDTLSPSAQPVLVFQPDDGIEDAVWSPDRRRIAVVAKVIISSQGNMTQSTNALWIVDPSGPTPAPVSVGQGLVSGISWLGPNRLYAEMSGSSRLLQFGGGLAPTSLPVQGGMVYANDAFFFGWQADSPGLGVFDLRNPTLPQLASFDDWSTQAGLFAHHLARFCYSSETAGAFVMVDYGSGFPGTKTTIEQFDVAPNTLPPDLAYSGDAIFSPDGKTLVYADLAGGTLLARDVSTGAKQPVVLESGSSPEPGSFSPDSRWLAYRAGSGDYRLVRRTAPGTFSQSVPDAGGAQWSTTGRWAIIGSGIADMRGDTPVEMNTGAFEYPLWALDDRWVTQKKSGPLQVVLLEPTFTDAGLDAINGLPVSASPSGMLAVQSGAASDQIQVLDPSAGASSLRTLDSGQFDHILGW